MVESLEQYLFHKGTMKTLLFLRLIAFSIFIILLWTSKTKVQILFSLSHGII